MFLQEKFNNPVIKLFRSDNLEFILSFFYSIFRAEEKNIDTIRQISLEKELEAFIKEYNKQSSEDQKNEENAKNYIESWIKNQFLRRIEIWDFEDDYNIELSESTMQIMNFFDNLWIQEEYLHASVQSDFENAIANLKAIAFSSEWLKEQNLKEIDRQIKALEQKKTLISKWDLKIFEEEVYDKYTSAKEILKRMPTNFRKVETVFENIYASIQKKSNDTELHRGDILSFTLDEIDDKINNSPQWKSFDWFEKFYSWKPKKLLNQLCEVLNNFDKIKVLEKQKSIKSLIEFDLLKAKKRAYNKKTFIVSKLREVFNESAKEERKMWISLIKDIKKVFIENNTKIEYKKNLGKINNWFGIDLFMWKNLWEAKNEVKLMSYNQKQEVEKEEIDIDNIFRYTSISEKQVLDRINKFLKDKDEVNLKEILAEYSVQYSIDEFMTYIKIAKAWKWNIKDFNRNKFDIDGIHNKLKIESGEVVFLKG